jgi:hypothetical protein
MKKLKNKVLAGFMLLVFFIFMFPVYGAYPYFRQDDATIYWYYTDEMPTAAWDASDGADHYIIELDWIRGDKTLQTYPLGTTTSLEMDIPAPRAGAFVVRVRACNDQDQCSDEWSASNDPTYARVDGQPKAWILIFSLAGTGPIIISKEEIPYG